MEALLWMTVVGSLIVAGLLVGFLRRSVWLGGGLVLLGIALAATMLLVSYFSLVKSSCQCHVYVRDCWRQARSVRNGITSTSPAADMEVSFCVARTIAPKVERVGSR